MIMHIRILLGGLVWAASCVGPAMAEDRAALNHRLDAAMTEYAMLDQFAGVALIADRGGVLLHAGYGLANRELGVAVEPGHRFVIGSMSKSFTAALAVLMAEDGLIDLDAPVRDYWTGFEDPSDGAITVRHLLTHRSGLHHWGVVDGFVETEALRAWSPRELVNRFAAEGLRFTPGEAVDYSSPGYMLVAIVLEEAGRAPFHALLADRIFRPLGLSGVIADSTRIIPDRVADYRFNFLDAVYENAEERHPSTQFGTGDLVVTARDLHIWGLAMSGARPDVLTPAILEVLTDPAAGRQAFGWHVAAASDGAEDAVLWHGGLVAGYRSQITINRSTGHIVVLLGNLRNIDASRITEGLFALLTGEIESPVRRDLMREILTVSAAEGGPASAAHAARVLDEDPEAYYPDPAGWLLAAVELRSDGACGRALPVYRLWLDRHPDHGLSAAATTHAVDCALRIGATDMASALIDRLPADYPARDGLEVRLSQARR